MSETEASEQFLAKPETIGSSRVTRSIVLHSLRDVTVQQVIFSEEEALRETAQEYAEKNEMVLDPEGPEIFWEARLRWTAVKTPPPLHFRRWKWLMQNVGTLGWNKLRNGAPLAISETQSDVDTSWKEWTE